MELSNIVFNFAKIIIMNILGTIDRCINLIPKELIESNIIYAEVDKESYDELDTEFSKITGDQNFTLQEQKVNDIGKCKLFNFREYKVIITQDKNKSRQESFYIAFKTKAI